MHYTTLISSALAMFAAAPVHANGPAWVAELSDTTTARNDSLSVSIPIGSHAAIAVYNSDAIEPKCPDGINATVRVMWFEHRSVFVGWPGEREEAIPYYLPMLKDCRPTGAWVVELEPEHVGTFTVPIACNTNALTITVECIELPRGDIGYGFYTDHHRVPDLSREREYNRDMAAHGMTTFTPYARIPSPTLTAGDATYVDDTPHKLAWHINTAIADGLVDVRFPLLCLSAGADAVVASKEFAKGEWPELVLYNRDEPSPEHGEEVRLNAEDAHAAGLKSGTAISGESALAIGDPLDIWVLHMDGVSDETIAAAEAKGKDLWMYNCALRGSNAAQHRYWTGVYTWAVGPRVCLTWTYMHDKDSRIQPDGTWNCLRVYDTATCDAEGLPIPTVALEGIQEGIIDSRFLQELERLDTEAGNAYLDNLKKSVPFGFWTNGHGRDYSSYVWDVPDLQVPPVDCVGVRREVLRLLEAAE